MKKLHDLLFNNNDIYILDHYIDTIIANDNYQGLLLLDFSLNIIQQIFIGKETTIYSLYKQYNGNRLMIYSSDEEQIILIDPNTSDNYIIKLLPPINEYIFSPNYYWHGDMLILTTFSNIFYQLCFATNGLQEISVNKVQKTCPTFFNFWNESKNYNVLTSYPKQLSFVFQENDETIGFLSVANNKKTMIQHQNDGWHDVEYSNNTFIFVYEKKLEIIHHNTQILLQPDSGYIFLRAKFVSEATIVVLSSKPGNHKNSLLQIYQLISE